MNTATVDALISSGQRTIATESQALNQLSSRIDERFAQACQLLLACKGRIIVIGIGKSGHIGRKLAATLASTGSPAFFVHPAEASHGDFGMITNDDTVIAISYSGSAQEILTLLPLLTHKALPLIGLTAKPDSALANAANVVLDISVEHEACPLNLAPTTSTTVTLALCDAIAVALLEAKEFSARDFAFSHPGGALGKRLLLTVGDIMHTDDRMPIVSTTASLSDALLEMSQKGFGITAIVDTDQCLIGVFTDGDLRRIMNQHHTFNQVVITDAMSTSPTVTTADTMAVDALGIMEVNAITALWVVDAKRRPEGIIHLHDLLRSGIL